MVQFVGKGHLNDQAQLLLKYWSAISLKKSDISPKVRFLITLDVYRSKIYSNKTTEYTTILQLYSNIECPRLFFKYAILGCLQF